MKETVVTAAMQTGATGTAMVVFVALVIMADTINPLIETDVFIINTNKTDSQFPSVLDEK